MFPMFGFRSNGTSSSFFSSGEASSYLETDFGIPHIKTGSLLSRTKMVLGDDVGVCACAVTRARVNCVCLLPLPVRSVLYSLFLCCKNSNKKTTRKEAGTFLLLSFHRRLFAPIR